MNKNETISCVNYNHQPEWMPWSGTKVCPNCGSHEIEYNTRIVLTSYPAQSQLRCRTCSHIFSSGMNIEWTDNDALNDKWEHDQSILNIPKVGDWPPSPQPGDWPPSLTPCDPLPATNKTTMYGWVCPKCGKVNAPHRDFCDCSGNHNPNIVYCNGTGNNPNPAPSITISDAIDALNYSFEACNLHEKENNNGNL